MNLVTEAAPTVIVGSAVFGKPVPVRVTVRPPLILPVVGDMLLTTTSMADAETDEVSAYPTPIYS